MNDFLAWAALYFLGFGVAKIKGGTTVFGPNALTDTSGTLTSWFDDTDCGTAILRPDSYVYGISNTAADLHSQLAQLFTSLGLR